MGGESRLFSTAIDGARVVDVDLSISLLSLWASPLSDTLRVPRPPHAIDIHTSQRKHNRASSKEHIIVSSLSTLPARVVVLFSVSTTVYSDFSLGSVADNFLRQQRTTRQSKGSGTLNPAQRTMFSFMLSACAIVLIMCFVVCVFSCINCSPLLCRPVSHINLSPISLLSLSLFINVFIQTASISLYQDCTLLIVLSISRC